MRCTIVSHTHWDREWYRTFQSFRARLVDTVDRVLDLVARDPGYAFQLDGQSIAIEDYLEIRPERRDELEAACRAGRVAIGPWYVQPDSLMPSGESHVRNLLEGRRIAEQFGPSCRVAYTPDSFGHPAQFPQLFAGFGLDPFVYWRGNGNEIEELGNEYRWRAPDGSEIRCAHLARGYFNAWGFAADAEAVARRLETVAREIAETTKTDSVLLMNGLDHMLPDENTREVAEALAKLTGWQVERGLLEDFVRTIPEEGLPEFTGELLGARVGGANLLPGVWSTRTPLKLANRHCEAMLEGWAEPWSCLASALGARGEQPALRSAWRTLLANQAHDSICGCSKDEVHEQMVSRYQNVSELALETTHRALERVAGLGVTRQVRKDGGDSIEIAVFNPSPHPRSDRVRLKLDGFPAFSAIGVARLLEANIGAEGFTIDDRPARLIPEAATVRPSPIAGQSVHELEFVARDVPAFGWKRVSLRRADRCDDEIDAGREIENERVAVSVARDGTLDVRIGERTFEGLAALEDVGDRGDTYDFDAIPGEPAEPVRCDDVEVERRRHAAGIQELRVRRRLRVPRRLAPQRDARSPELVELEVLTLARISEGVERVDLEVHLHNTAEDHRLRLLFPTRTATTSFRAATTFDVAQRTTARKDDARWTHPAPTTIPSQGWLAANGLAIAAPGLIESEVDSDGCIALTLLRATGWLSQTDLVSRPVPAGPALETPGAQCKQSITARLSLFSAPTTALPNLARDAELGLRAVAAGPEPLCPAGTSLLSIEPSDLLLSALKPAESGDGLVLRILNPGDEARRAVITLGFDLHDDDSVEPVRLDEQPAEQRVDRSGGRLELEVPPHALRSVLVRRASPLA